MRPPLRLGSLLLVAALLLAGCTSDGNLGAIDEAQQRERAIERQSTLWEAPASAHVADVRIRGSMLDIQGGWTPLPLASATLTVTTWSPDLLREGAVASRIAIAGATLDGERGWLVLNATSPPTLDAREGNLTLRDHSLRAEGAALAARVGGTGLLWTEHAPFGCFDAQPRPDETPECRAWREERPPEKPEALANLTEVRFLSVELPAEATVRGLDLLFYDANGSARALSSEVQVGTQHARLVALFDHADASPLLAASLDVPLVAAPSADWRGNLTVHATPPSGELALPHGTRPLALHNEATVKMRGQGPARLTLEGQEWQLAQDDVEVVDVRTGPTPRLAATLRLAPDLVDAVGPAGNTTRVKLILAETSRGADAHLTGYRIDTSVQARYVGSEPFAITNELFALMNETGANPLTAPALLGIGLAIPYVMMAEAFAAFFQALFPPSLAGTLGAGEGQLLTFELRMPETPQDVEILIEAENADPVRATIRMRPSG